MQHLPPSALATPRLFHVLIAAAGSGERFGADVPKQYAKIHQKSVLRHTLEDFLAIPGLQSLRVIINPDHAELYHDAVSGLSLEPPIYGSKTRKSSIYNGLKELYNLKNEEIVLVHDAARPIVSRGTFQELLESLDNFEAATLAIPVSDTLRRGDETVDRNGLWAIQTPQAFRLGTLRKAHEQNIDATDDASLVSALGLPVKLVMGSKQNIKITLPEDLELAAKLLQKNYSIRTGMGFDVHAFDKNDKNRPLMLCGIKVDHPYGLAGHSDADVGLHAITDALLGALAAGDIGHHFPPSNPAYKNMSSDIFLKKAGDIAAEKNALIENIDVTLICEEPKIGPYREQMQNRIASILGLTPSQIGVKATTTEKLGFTGRGEGIAAQAIATVKIPEGV